MMRIRWILIIVTLVSGNYAIAATSSTSLQMNVTDSSDSSAQPLPQQTRILCPQETIGSSSPTKYGKGYGVLLNSTPQGVYFNGPIDTESKGESGGMYFPYFTGGGRWNFSCPSDHPFLAGFDEAWGGGGLFPYFVYYQATMTAYCATSPEPPMSLSALANQNWVSGTHCP